jgi:hypothetical protein
MVIEVPKMNIKGYSIDREARVGKVQKGVKLRRWWKNAKEEDNGQVVGRIRLLLYVWREVKKIKLVGL